MDRHLKHKASTLLFLFVLGSMVAPFSHYLFMVVSDAYHVGNHHQVEHAPHHASHDMSGKVYADASGHHDLCDYWSLFATFSAAAPATVQVAPATVAEYVAIEYDAFFYRSNEPLTALLRGPPISTSVA